LYLIFHKKSTKFTHNASVLGSMELTGSSAFKRGDEPLSTLPLEGDACNMGVGG